MFAKLYFDSSWQAQADLFPVIFAVLTGATNVNSIPGATAKFVPSLSYILTNKSASGWTSEVNTASTKIMSSPCKDSAKRKYVRFDAPSAARISTELVEAGSYNGTTGALTGIASYNDTSTMANNIVYSGTTNTYPHATQNAVEVWISASPRHFLVALNQPGYQHGAGTNGGRAGGWVVGVVEHSPSDSWITESSPYIPACVMTSATNTASINTGTLTFYRNRSRNIANPVAADIIGNAAGALLEGYTKYGSGQIGNITLNGTNLVLLDENNAVRTLLPFGARSKTALVRGGSITDVCDLYLAPANIFKENLQIQVGDNEANKYHVWNLGFSASTTVGYNLIVPRG